MQPFISDITCNREAGLDEEKIVNAAADDLAQEQMEGRLRGTGPYPENTEVMGWRTHPWIGHTFFLNIK